MKKISLMFLAVFLLSFLGCEAVITEEQSKADMRKEEVSASESVEKRGSFAQENNKFAVAMYKKINEKSGDSNIFFSPFSIYTAFGMLYEGAASPTSEEFEKVFGFSADVTATRAEFHKQMESYGKFKKEGLSVANSLWVNNDFKIEDAYKEVLGNYYYAQAENLDFSKAASADKINKWVYDNTAGRIKNIINKDALTGSAMILANTVYFKSKWAIEFDPRLTKKEDFFITPENKVKADLMKNRSVDYKYIENDDVQAVMLDYWRNFSMIAVLPKSAEIETAESFIFNNEIESLHKMFSVMEGTVIFPKFELEWEDSEIFEKIKELGIKTGNYSKITPDEAGISKVMHKTFIKVDEKETEAAAVTAEVISGSALIQETQEPFVFRADRPFVYMIVDNTDGKILFLGKMINPNK